MRKIYNKDEVKTNPDYLNFIRRNQQIVREFKEITQLETKTRALKKNYSGVPNPRTIEVDRYSDPNEKQDYKVTSLRDIIPSYSSAHADIPITQRKGLSSQPFRTEIYTRNHGIPVNESRNYRQSFDKSDNNDEVKLPKLPSRLSKHNISQRSDNSENSLEKNVVMESSADTPNKPNKRKTDRSSEWEFIKKNYAPISIDTSKKDSETPTRPKVKSMKFTDITKTKLNNKLIRTYYDYENLIELKDRVFELLPTFKPLQSKKKERVHVFQVENPAGQLEQLLETSVLRRPELKPTQMKIGAREQRKMQDDRKSSAKSMKVDEQPEGALQSEKKSYSSTSPTKPKKSGPPILFNNVKSSEQTVYSNKIKSYREFLFLVNFAHRVFDPIILKDDPDRYKPENKLKYHIGRGNNSLLVKSLMKRRFWWVQTDDPKEANFVWTQLKINTYYQFQCQSQLVDRFDKLDEDYPAVSPKKKKLAKSKIQLDSNKKIESGQKIGGILRGQLPEGERKIFTNADIFYLTSMFERAQEDNPQLKNFSRFETRLKYLPEEFLKKRDPEETMNLHVHNHFACNYEIGNKKALFYNLKHYYELIGVNPFDTIPLTFHIKKGLQDPQFAKFSKQFKRLKGELTKAEKANSPTKKLSRNVWIIKPGELSNRGNGITVVDEMYEINSILKSKEKHTNGQDKTYIIQKYIEKPMLYKNRKFDIRHYMMISRLHGRMRAYWFSEGYIRTSCYEYDIEEVGDSSIHLTNDAIQKHCPSYGKYEQGNKLSYSEFQRYLDSTYPDKKYSFIEQVYPRMREIATDAVKSTYLWMDPLKSEHNFQIFGLDFMIDSHFGVWLIEVNTNPCLELSSQLLARIIPTMLENTLRLGLDPLFPPPAHYANTIKYLAPDTPMERLQYQLIFDESRDGKALEQVLLKAGKADCGQIEEQDETYQNEGKQMEGDLQ